MIRATIGIFSQGGIAIDADAQAFFDRVTTAGGTLSKTEQTAVNTLVLQMKADGIWSSMKAIYPMVGASAAACAQNLKSSSFTGTFNGGLTFANTGVTGNGSNGYMNTNFDISTLSQNSTHASVYNGKTNLWEARFIFGVYTSGDNALAALNYPNLVAGQNALIGFAQDLGPDYTPNNVSSGGLHLINRQGSTIKQHWIRNVKTQYSRFSDAAVSGYSIVLLANNNTGSIGGFANQEISLFTIGDGLTDAEAGLFYTAVQAFQTTLSRNV